MKRFRVWLLLAAIAALAFAGVQFTPKTSGQGPQATRKAQPRVDLTPPNVPNYDIRALQSKADAATFAAYRKETLATMGADGSEDVRRMMAAGQSELAAGVPGLHVEANQFGTAPEIVGVEAGCHCALTTTAAGAHEPFVRRFVATNAALYGLTAAQVAELRVVADYANPAGNMSWVEYEQRINNIPVFQGYLRAALTSDGRLARTTGNLAAGLDYATLPTVAGLTPNAAVVAGAGAINAAADPLSLYTVSVTKGGRTTKLAPGPFTEEIKTELMYFPLEPGVATLAYAMTLWLPHNAYYVLVDAHTGQLLWRKNISQQQTQPVTYSVYDNDSPTPLSPTTSLPGLGTQGTAISRTTFNIVSELPAFDNLGWITDSAGNAVTTGNNVDAGLDIDGVNGIDAGGRAVGTGRVFNFAYNPGGTPGEEAPTGTNYRMGIVTNIFFWTNRYHDRLYQLGFTEPARNFQQNNFGRGGTGNDFVRAEAQDSSGTNNANFDTPADGSLPRMQMYIFTGPSPQRDGDIDGDVFIHELTHGTSNRLHANAAGLATTQSGGMGEGWSDFYARALLATADEDVDGIYASGGYVTKNLGALGTDNYYYGIRRFPYAVKTNVGGPTALRPGQPHNPITFADIDTALFSITDGAYNRNPGLNQAQAANEVHAIGEVWCMMLLEMRARIIHRLGFAAGNQRALQIVTDAMKLDPASPTILQARDSILAADCAGFGGADEQDIWAGFATRGAGFSATTTGGTTTAADVVEAFDTPNLTLGAVTFSDAAGNNNGAADPGETITLNVPLANPFCGADATNTTANINGGGNANYGTITHGTNATQPITYTVPANTVCGAQIVLPIAINSSLGQVTRNYTLQTGTLVIGQQQTFSNTTPITIPATGTGAATGAPATPYPSNITVAGFASTISQVTVTLTNMNHTFPGDVDVLLVSPTGRKFILLSDAIGTADWTGQTYTFADSAAAVLASAPATVPPSGLYKPTNYGSADAFPAPAPAAPYLSPATDGTDTLTSAFTGAVGGNPNGTWSLYVVDDAGTDVGNFNGGWSLTLTSASYQCAAVCGFNAQPANITQSNDANTCGAVVNFSLPTLTCGGNVTSSPQSGSTFPVGQTTVNVTGTPAGGGANVTTSFTVTVNDTQNPSFNATPPDVFVASTNGTNAVVNFAAPAASDNCPGVTVTSAPASGSTFNVGTTQVTHTATDAHGRTATTTSNVNVTPPVANGDVIISEFRIDGPNGPSDEYVELYNNTNAPVTVATGDGSAGWAVGWSVFCGVCPNDGFTGTYFVIPNGTQIPARHHLLWTNIQTDNNNVYRGYSLNDYGGTNAAAGDLTFNGFTFSADEDNDVRLNGIALFTSATQANWSLANRLDAVGYSDSHVPLFVEGPGNPYLFGEYKISSQYAFVRKLTSGFPQDTNNNANDFDIVSNTGPFTIFADLFTLNVPAILGAPGPENLASPIQRNAQIKTSLIEPQQASTVAPNRVRDTTANSCGGPNCTQGTLDIRRRFKNSTGGAVTRLRIRVVDITTASAPPGTADLRLLTSGNLSVTTSLGALTVVGTIVETPPAQTSGGGLNTSALVNLPGQLGPNVSVDVHFLLGVQQGGTFRFLINIEALP